MLYTLIMATRKTENADNKKYTNNTNSDQMFCF